MLEYWFANETPKMRIVRLARFGMFSGVSAIEMTADLPGNNFENGGGRW